MSQVDDDIKLACEAMKKGGVILYPTDTVWGIGCDATCSDAVRRVFEIKRRADNKAMIVMLGNINDLERYVDDVPDVAYDLIEMSITPLTIVYDKGRYLASELLGEDGSVGIRITSEDFSKRLCLAYRRPIVSTSANVSGEPTAMTFADIKQDIKSQVDYIVKTRQEDVELHAPSSVIKLSSDGQVKIIRR